MSVEVHIKNGGPRNARNILLGLAFLEETLKAH